MATKRKHQVFPIRFGKVTYPKGTVKKALRWIWICDCEKCQPLELARKFHGPFKTLREAERDAESVITLVAAEPGGARH